MAMNTGGRLIAGLITEMSLFKSMLMRLGRKFMGNGAFEYDGVVLREMMDDPLLRKYRSGSRRLGANEPLLNETDEVGDDYGNLNTDDISITTEDSIP